ncbi:hypothetical protein F5X97DRAFT_324952 [Nemania serpens]|nr:hypothetical protein F5X97DRAFT_324952 [Nemania serpens]
MPSKPVSEQRGQSPRNHYGASPSTKQCKKIRLVRRDARNGTAPSSGSNRYSHLKLTHYQHKKLCSIFDFSTRRFIYLAERDAEKGYRVSYFNNGKYEAIFDSKGALVYVNPRGSDC